MPNTSYCRFENTLRDMVACHNAIEELLAGNGEPLSDSELRCAVALVEQCKETLELIADEQGIDMTDEYAFANLDPKDALDFANGAIEFNENDGGKDVDS